MPTIRVEKTKQYTVISNHHLKDKRLSLKSIGLLTIMLSLPDGWDFSVSGFAKICKDGITAINSAMKELEVYGYVQRNYTRDQKGRYIDIEYVVREVPLAEIPAQNPIVENPILDKPREINTNLIKYLMEDGYARANEGFSSDGADKNTEHFSPSSTVTVPPSPSGASPLPAPGGVPGRDPSYAAVAAEYQRNFGMQPMGVISDAISQGIQELCPEAVIYAIHAAKKAGALRSPWRYMSRVIESMIAAGVKDAAGVEAYKEQIEQKNGRAQTKTWEEVAEEAERLAAERQSLGGRIPLSEKWAKVAEKAERLAAERDKNHDS